MKSAFKIFLICTLFLTTYSFARVDNRTYVKDLNIAAIWVNPKNIKVYVAPDKKDKILKESFKIWNDSLRGNVRFVFIENESDADITIAFVDQLNGNKLGVTNSKYINIQGRIYLHKTKVLVSKRDPIGFIVSDGDLRRTALHEIAHAIGVLGHSKHISDIMYPTTASVQSTPSVRDIDTVRKIYGF